MIIKLADQKPSRSKTNSPFIRTIKFIKMIIHHLQTIINSVYRKLHIWNRDSIKTTISLPVPTLFFQITLRILICRFKSNHNRSILILILMMYSRGDRKDYRSLSKDLRTQSRLEKWAKWFKIHEIVNLIKILLIVRWRRTTVSQRPKT